jgi:diacylglycerol O-acyltransferase
MRYLSGLDNLFLEQETHSQHMHVAGLGIYDPSTAAGGKVRFKTVLDFFTARIAEEPVFRRRLITAPMGIDRPLLVDDPRVDVEYHVRHLALPHPGDWRQLMIQIARIHSRPLDRSKPLWEAYIIEGLDSIPGLPEGCFALYLKLHHALVDGEAAAQLIGSLHTLTPDFDQAAGRSEHAIIADREPNTLELVSRAVGHRTRQLAGAGELGVLLGREALKTAKSQGPSLLRRGQDLLVEQLGRAGKQDKKRPSTRFNAPITPHRVLDAVGFSLEDCQAIRRDVDGSTINDIFLTVVGGAIQRYLEAKGESPDGSLMGTMPMTLRGADKSGDVGNQIAQVYYSLRTDLSDPVARLRAVNGETAKVKQKSRGGPGADIQKRLLDVLPASLIVKPLTQALGANSNVNVSNVRGPDRPLYMAGARLEMFIPFSLIFEGCGLNITGFSYNGILWVAVTCCRSMLPDPAFFSQCLQQSFDELMAAAAVHGNNHDRIASLTHHAAPPRSRGQRKPVAGKAKTRPKNKRAPARSKRAPR